MVHRHNLEPSSQGDLLKALKQDLIPATRQFLIALFAAIYFTAGSSLRPTELLRLQFVNTTHLSRNIFQIGTEVVVCMHGEKHGSWNKANKLIFHYLPAEVGQVLVEYLLFFKFTEQVVWELASGTTASSDMTQAPSLHQFLGQAIRIEELGLHVGRVAWQCLELKPEGGHLPFRNIRHAHIWIMKTFVLPKVHNREVWAHSAAQSNGHTLNTEKRHYARESLFLIDQEAAQDAQMAKDLCIAYHDWFNLSSPCNEPDEPHQLQSKGVTQP